MATGTAAAPNAEHVIAVFEACDHDGDGAISQADLEATLRKLAGKSQGSRALFSAADKNGDGVLDLAEFADAAFPSASGSSPLGPLPRSPYFEQHALQPFIVRMANELDAAKPDDPYAWMMQFLVKQRPRNVSSSSGATTAGGGAAAAAPAGARRRGNAYRINIGSVMRRTPKKLLDVVLEDEAFEAAESIADTRCQIYFVWDSDSFLARLGHPALRGRSIGGCEVVPRMPKQAWVNRFPGMGHLCDKVNMALALRFLQQLWPEKFAFWPKSWLLPAEMDQLRAYLDKHREQTVIVKPADGSLGEGIFLVQSKADLDVKMLAKSNWGAGFAALAQRYVPRPLLIGGLKFDLRLYCVVTSFNPLCAYLCREGLARFCTEKYEEPTAANANQHYMHLTNYSVNKKSAGFVKAVDPFDPDTRASKRPLSTLLRQIEMQEAGEGRTFDEGAFYDKCEEVVAVLLQAVAPVLNTTYTRVAKDCKPTPKAKAKPKAKRRTSRSPPARRRAVDSDDEQAEGESGESEDGEYEPQCYQMLGIDVLLDDRLQPWLLEMNARPSMDIEEPVRMSEAPAGMRRCPCRDMDGEEHVHLPSVVDVHVKRMAVRGAFQIVLGETVPAEYIELDFNKFGPMEDVQSTMQLLARLYQVAGGADKAFTTFGVRRALAPAIRAGLSATDLDSAVSRWKHQGYRQSGELERDTAEIGVLDFAALLQEVARTRMDEDEEPLDALVSMIEECDPD